MKLYFDTNIIRDYIENRNSKSIELLEKARNEGWDCVTSAFTMMELADLEQDTIFFHNTVARKKWDVDRFLRERKQKTLTKSDFDDLENYLTNVLVRLPFLSYFNLSGDGWELARESASRSVLSAVDSIHLATAYSSMSELIVTNDTNFIKHGNVILQGSKRKGKIKVCLPEKVVETAQEMGLT